MTFLRLFTVFVAMIAFSVCGSDQPGTVLPTAVVHVTNGVQDETLTVELAVTAPERETGLMDRQSMAEDAGMLFLFPERGTIGFWMHNTYLPLSIAYLAKDGTVLEIVDGKPLDDTVLTPHQAYWSVLEVNQGWFQRHNLGVGSKLVAPPGLPVPR